MCAWHFRGGVDSSLLLYLAARAAADQGSKLYALTFDTNLHPRTDMKAAPPDRGGGGGSSAGHPGG